MIRHPTLDGSDRAGDDVMSARDVRPPATVRLVDVDAMSLRFEAALLGKLALHGRFNFVGEAAEMFMQLAVDFPLGLIGR
jgi:hypothetical protein